jgi:hypothetical protein
MSRERGERIRAKKRRYRLRHREQHLEAKKREAAKYRGRYGPPTVSKRAKLRAEKLGLNGPEAFQYRQEYRRRAVAYMERNREWITASKAERRRRWRETAKDRYAEKAKESHRRLIQSDPEYYRKRLLSRYRLTPAVFKSMAEAQGNRCAICKRKSKLVVDHCHAAGHTRGLVCGTCNIGLGMFKDTPALLIAAAKYLQARAIPMNHVGTAQPEPGHSGLPTSSEPGRSV